MTLFSTYFLMDTEEIKSYVKENISFMRDATQLEATEIGDGNLNYVFRVKDMDSGKSVIIKQAGHTARISEDFKLSTDRIRIETRALQLAAERTPELVPEIYLFDEVMSCCAMEDLGDFTIMRAALMEHRIFPHFAEHISTYMAENLLPSTDVVMEHKVKKATVKNFINPELCEISEDLVFTEPYFNQNNRNIVQSENAQFVQEQLYDNKPLHLEVAKLKYLFLTKAQSLLHGDLHTGSIFITENETKVIDPEFAFYGPIGYDVGNVIANLSFSWVNGQAQQQDEFTRWIEDTIRDTIDLFGAKFKEVWKREALELFAVKSDAFMDFYLQDILSDSAGMAGLEMNRRIVGLAQVKDITELEHTKHVQAEKLCIQIANRFILERDTLQTGEDFVRVLHDLKEDFS
ncbi:5-methylribose kinase [Planococcus donghaensis MPA1U2]|uniref:S-methyl-5-thioribose kinase n=1 Tax=Planococcus donghaensis MPA1U2 TaxID=933115 RepID=E7RDT4_9BACL|nr:S-methyl-5-thioribose kinase [Planococcus donghaensis]EGA90840.1 5-methylribose kinase [Planococcus donghaensis MPA1U2]